MQVSVSLLQLNDTGSYNLEAESWAGLSQLGSLTDSNKEGFLSLGEWYQPLPARQGSQWGRAFPEGKASGCYFEQVF